MGDNVWEDLGPMVVPAANKIPLRSVAVDTILLLVRPGSQLNSPWTMSVVFIKDVLIPYYNPKDEDGQSHQPIELKAGGTSHWVSMFNLGSASTDSRKLLVGFQSKSAHDSFDKQSGLDSG